MHRLLSGVQPARGIAVFALASTAAAAKFKSHNRAPLICESKAEAFASRRPSAQLQSIAAYAAESGANIEVLDILKDAERKLWLRGRVHKIVVTGGPCGGKSTVLVDLTQMLQDRNYLVCQMPEVATMMYEWSGSRMWQDYDKEEVNAHLQVLMTKLQMDIEDAIEQLAQQSLMARRDWPNPPRGVVILYDRGVVDNKAYCSESVWSTVLNQLHTTTARLRDQRYDHIIHLVTAANGAEQFYTLEQSEGTGARHERADEARLLDSLTQKAWGGAQNLHIVGNVGVSWIEKRERVKQVVLEALGEKVQGSSQRRLLCKYMPAHEITEKATLDPDVRWPARIREHTTGIARDIQLQMRKGADDTVTYYVQKLATDGSVYSQYQIDDWTYRQKLQQTAAFGTDLGERTRELVMFTYKDSYIRCNAVNTGIGPMLIVEVDQLCRVELPPWLQQVPDVPKDHPAMTLKL